MGTIRITPAAEDKGDVIYRKHGHLLYNNYILNCHVLFIKQRIYAIR